MIDLVAGAVVVILVGGAAWYLVQTKKNGVKCVGCSAGSGCPGSYKQKKKKLKGNIIARKRIVISGMHCARCARSVTDSLNEIEGVSASADISRGCAEIMLDREIFEEVLIHAVEKEGFLVKEITESMG